MQLPVQVTFRNLEASEAVEATIREKAAKLEKFAGRISGCRVVVEAPHKHRHKGNLYRVLIDVTVPDGELVVSRGPDRHQSHADVYVAIRDAFDALRRQLEEHTQRMHGRVKHRRETIRTRPEALVPEVAAEGPSQ